MSTLDRKVSHRVNKNTTMHTLGTIHRLGSITACF